MSEQKRILLVDKLNDITQKTISVFKKHNINCIIAESYDKAVEATEQIRFDLILVNPLLQNKSESSFIERFNKNIYTSFIPVIVIVQSLYLEDIKKYAKGGAGDFIMSPIFEDAKITRIKFHLENTEYINELRESNNRFRISFENSSVANALISKNRYIACNDAFLKLFGYKEDEIIGKSPGIVSPKYQPDGQLSSEKAQKLIKLALKTGNISLEWIHCKASGKHFPGKINFTPIPYNHEIIIHVSVEDLSRQKQNEDLLKASEKRYKRLFEKSPIPMILHKNDRFFMINKALEEFMEITDIKQIMNKSVYDFILKKYHKEVKEKSTLILKGEKVPLTEIQVETLKGNIKTIQTTGFLIEINNEPLILSSFIDISKLKQVEKEIKINEQKYKAIIDASNDAIFAINTNAKILFINKQQEVIFGRKNKFVKGRVAFEFIPESEHPKIREQIANVLRNKKIEGIESYVYNNKFHKIPVEVNARLIKIEQKHVIVGTLKDISQRKKQQQKFETLLKNTLTTKDFLQRIMNTTNDVIFAKDIYDKYIFANKTYKDLLGIGTESLKGKTDYDFGFNPANDNSTNIFALQRSRYLIKDKEQYFDKYNALTTPNGEKRVFQTETVKLRNNNGKLYAFLFYAHDITRQAEAEQKLQEHLDKKAKQLESSKESFKQLFEQSQDIILISNEEGQIIDTNQKACELLEYSKPDLLNLNIADITTGKEIEKRKQVIREMRQKKSLIFETENLTKSGRKIPIEVNSSIINLNNQTFILSIGRDISERIEAQKRHLKAILDTEETERNRFAKELHDGLGATLSGIKMYIDVLSENKVEQERIPDILSKTKELIDEAAQSAREIANNIKPHVLTNLGLRKSIQILADKFTSTGKIKIRCDLDNYNITLNKNLELSIYRIVSELINNTIKHAKAKHVNISLEHKKGRFILFYTDDGIGFDIQKVLVSNAGNRGNGIQNIYNRIESLNGLCIMESKPNEGTSVKIRIIIDDYEQN